MTPDFPHFPKRIFWDRQGQPIADFMDWALKAEDDAYRIIACDTIGGLVVSTIWIGIDGIGELFGGKPMIFETLVFEGDKVVGGEKNATESEARSAHALYIEKCKDPAFVLAAHAQGHQDSHNGATPL